jgi:hypothetical protein
MVAPNNGTCVFHGGQYTTVSTEEEVNDQAGTGRMDEMLEAIQPESNLDTKDRLRRRLRSSSDS